jgi:excisionase family DNA binding protein
MMSHREAVTRLVDLLKAEYKDCFVLPERSIVLKTQTSSRHSNRVIPDITVLKGSDIVLIIEIGVIDAEKICAYQKEVQIPEISWYDKKLNQLFHWVRSDKPSRTKTTVINHKGYLTVKEVAELLRIKKTTVRVWIHRGLNIPYLKINSVLLFPQVKLEEWLEKKMISP